MIGFLQLWQSAKYFALYCIHVHYPLFLKQKKKMYFKSSIAFNFFKILFQLNIWIPSTCQVHKKLNKIIYVCRVHQHFFYITSNHFITSRSCGWKLSEVLFCIYLRRLFTVTKLIYMGTFVEILQKVGTIQKGFGKKNMYLCLLLIKLFTCAVIQDIFPTHFYGS